MGKRASDRAGKCKTCGTAFNQGDQINLGKKPDGNWAVCPNDECYNGQISGQETIKPTVTPNPKESLNNFTKKPSKSADLTQKIISWEGLLKVYAVVWSGKNLE